MGCRPNFLMRWRCSMAEEENPRTEAVIDQISNTEITSDIETPVVGSIRRKLAEVSPLSTECCIYRVPNRLRKQNEKAYTPHVVSIGPIHHGQKHLEAMENHKFRSLQMFLNWTNMRLEDVVEFIKEREVRLRNSYAEPILEHASDEFIEILLLDAIFIVVLLLYNEFPHQSTDQEERRLYGKQKLTFDVLHDLVLLENQIPFILLDHLLAFVKNVLTEIDQGISMLGLVRKMFRNWYLTKEVPLEINCFDVKHIVDFLRAYHLPLKLPRKVVTMCPQLTNSCLTELHEAGVQFEKNHGSLIEVQFRNGVLSIPCIVIDDRAEILLRNIVAFEQCHGNELYTYISDYVILMDCLINTHKDIELLVKYGIMDNQLVDSQDAASLFNNLSKGVTYEAEYFYFSTLCEDLNAYSRVRRHRWMANLRHEYFKNPWKILSIVAAVILLVLTAIQTACSLISLL